MVWVKADPMGMLSVSSTWSGVTGIPTSSITPLTYVHSPQTLVTPFCPMNRDELIHATVRVLGTLNFTSLTLATVPKVAGATLRVVAVVDVERISLYFGTTGATVQV